MSYLFYYTAAPFVFLFCSKVQEQFVTLNNEIEGLKRASKDEMLKNEHLTIILKKIHSEEANLKHLTSVWEEKGNTVEMQLSAVHSMLEQTDKEMQGIMLVSVHVVKRQESTPFCFNSVVQCVASGFDRLVISMLASGTQDRGFPPGRSCRIFSGEKVLSMPSFGREVKPFAPCRRFAAC
jgi:hypothetical protein